VGAGVREGGERGGGGGKGGRKGGGNKAKSGGEEERGGAGVALGNALRRGGEWGKASAVGETEWKRIDESHGGRGWGWECGRGDGPPKRGAGNTNIEGY